MAPLSGFYLGAATGLVSRRRYLWVGAGYQRQGRWSSGNADRQSDVGLGSLVFAWRPSFFDTEYPRPDIRFFWETTGEWIGSSKRGQSSTMSSGGGHYEDGAPSSSPITRVAVLPNSGAARVFSGPTFLCTYRGFAFQTGVLFQAWSHLNGNQHDEKLRVIAGVTYYFQRGRK